MAVVVFCALGLLTYRFVSKSSKQATTPATQNEQSYGEGQKKGNGRGEGFGKGNGNGGPLQSRKNCLSDGCLAIDDLSYPAGELTDTAKTALQKALDDEYKAQATYEAIISKLGGVRPFIMIFRAEEQHISSLKALFDKYGMAIKENPYTGKVTSPNTLSEACTAGVEAEIANAKLYKDDLLPAVEEYEDITQVFTNLMNASEQKHLVAFKRCALN